MDFWAGGTHSTRRVYKWMASNPWLYVLWHPRTPFQIRGVTPERLFNQIVIRSDDNIVMIYFGVILRVEIMPRWHRLRIRRLGLTNADLSQISVRSDNVNILVI